MSTIQTTVRLALALAAALPVTGCYKASIHLAEAPAVRSPTVDGAFHFSLINLIELSAHVDLEAACPGAGPTTIEERLSVPGGIVNAIFGTFLPFFSVMNPSVDCGAGLTDGPPGALSSPAS